MGPIIGILFLVFLSAGKTILEFLGKLFQKHFNPQTLKSFRKSDNFFNLKENVFTSCRVGWLEQMKSLSSDYIILPNYPLVYLLDIKSEVAGQKLSGFVKSEKQDMLSYYVVDFLFVDKATLKPILFLWTEDTSDYEDAIWLCSGVKVKMAVISTKENYGVKYPFPVSSVLASKVDDNFVINDIDELSKILKAPRVTKKVLGKKVSEKES